jgi:hypothetical protein
MLHNSLFRRDLLLAMNREPLVLHRRDVHRNVVRWPGAKPSPGGFVLDGDWAVHPARDDAAARAVAEDARDFLKRLGVAVNDNAAKQILFETGSSAAGFRCAMSPDRIEVHAADNSSLWAGWVHLENAMREAGGPFLHSGEVSRQPAWQIQIAPPTWGANYAVPDLLPEYLGDDTFRSLAHAGADGLFIYGDFLLYAKGTALAEIEQPDADVHLRTLREATERAAAFGIKLYFIPVGPKLPPNHALFARLPEVRGARLNAPTPLHCLCSTSKVALEFHAEVFRRLFREAPLLGGLILIIGGESYYHCFMRAADSAIGDTNCPHCHGKVAEDVIANLLKVSADALDQSQPAARVMAWPYSAHAFWSKERDQLELIDRLPPNVALLSEVDKDQVVTRGALRKLIWDYSVDYDGHSDRIVAQAMRCAHRERSLFVKTETSHGIELLHMPYAPAIGRSAVQWQSVRALRPRGVLQRWGFIGMFDSAAERIGYLARWDPNFAPEAATLTVARQLFGELAPQIVEAWRQFDDAVHHIPVLTTGGYYCGPSFLGPCHPLPVWDRKSPVPDAFRGNLFYLSETEPTLSNARANAKDDLTLGSTRQLGVPAELAEIEFAKARDAAKRGYEQLISIKPDDSPPPIAAELVEQQALGEYLYLTFRATVNTIRFLRQRETGIEDTDPRQREVAADELENARSAATIYQRAPWLNHKLRLDVGVPDSIGMVSEKIRLLDDFLKRTNVGRKQE